MVMNQGYAQQHPQTVGPNPNQQQNGVPQKEKAYIRVEPIPFESTSDTQITTLLDLTSLVCKLFKLAIPDLEGAVITPDTTSGQLYTSLYFSAQGNGNVMPLGVAARGTNVPLMERVNAFNMRSRSKTMELSSETKELLEDFIYRQPNKPVEWDKIAYEVVSQEAYGQKIMMKVDGINLTKVLKTLYGSKEGESRYDFQITLNKMIGMIAGPNANWILSVTRLDMSEVEKLAAKAGMMPSVGSIYMVRG